MPCSPTRRVTAESQRRTRLFHLCYPAWDETSNTIYLSASLQLWDPWTTDIINGEHCCINPYLPLEEIQVRIENSELPRNSKYQTCAKQIYSSYILKVDQEYVSNVHRSQPQATTKIKAANGTPVATFSYYAIYQLMCL